MWRAKNDLSFQQKGTRHLLIKQEKLEYVSPYRRLNLSASICAEHGGGWQHNELHTESEAAIQQDLDKLGARQRRS